MALMNDSCVAAEYLACLGVYCWDWSECRGREQERPLIPTFIREKKKALEKAEGKKIQIYYDGIMWHFHITTETTLDSYF